MVFDGKKLAQEILDDLKAEMSSWKKKPFLAVVSLGPKSDNSSYILQKKKTAEFLGLGFENYHYEDISSSKKIAAHLNKIAKMDKVSAMVVQMPLPQNVNSSVVNIIPVKKDPDLLSDKSVGLFFNGRSIIDPPTPAGILKILKSESVAVKNKKAVVLGHGRLVGRFLVPMLLHEGGAVSVIEKNTPKSIVLELSQGADIIISAVGQPNLINIEMVKTGAAVIDAGFSLVDPVRSKTSGMSADAPAHQISDGIDGKITGDVDFEAVKNKAGLITPVPGGIGPVGVAMLFYNVVKLYKYYYKNEQ